MKIREIQIQDNQQIAAVIRKVLIELNVPKVGTAYADPQLDFMFETYSEVKSAYFVIENEGIDI
jgi:putative acetyltransferase